MNRTNTILVLLLALFLGFTFTSCEVETATYYDRRDTYDWWNDGYANPTKERIAMANMLRGSWRGATEARYRDENGLEQLERFDTEIVFSQAHNNAIYGSGVQRDYAGGSLSSARTFTWRLDYVSGNILIEYNKADGSTFTMEIPYNNLHLDNRTFSGVMQSASERDDFDYRRYGYSKILKLNK